MCATQRHRSLAPVLLVLAAVSLASAQYGGGTGEPNDPYLIGTPKHLEALRTDPNDWSKHFRLTADIDMAGAVFERALIAWDTYGLGDGFVGSYFTGSFEGAGHRITNLVIDTGSAEKGHDYLGLFGYIRNGAIRNLEILDMSIIGGTNSDYLGALAGRVRAATIENCHAAVTIQCELNCDYLGGLIGRASTSTLRNCETTCTITAGQNARSLGGIAGRASETDVIDCQSSAFMEAGSECFYLGGLIGRDARVVTRCHADVVISGGVNAHGLGGLIGTVADASLEGCFSTGTLSGQSVASSLGGLIGSVGRSTLTDCHSETTVEGGPGAYEIGGLAGQSYETTFTDCRADGPVLGGTNSDYLGGLVGSVQGVYSPDDQHRFKFIRCHTTSSVTGRENSDHVGGLIGSCKTGVTIYVCSSSGTVHAEEEVGGLVGWNEGQIVDCYSTSPVTSEFDADRLGGLVGRNNEAGVIYGCYATGAIVGAYNSDHLGGFVGKNQGTIRNCYAVGPVSGGEEAEDVGGFVGLNDSKGHSIGYCYSVGRVSSLGTALSVGGFVGQHTNGAILHCLWNTDTSGQMQGVGYLGSKQDGYVVSDLTTSQMQDAEVFAASHWGFVGDPKVGADAQWMMVEDHSGPVLRWQYESQVDLPLFSGGSGTETDPYLIATAEDLNQIGHVPRLMDKHFLMVADIQVLQPASLYMIGHELHPFTGIFDGGSHRLDVSVPVAAAPYDDHMGLFGYLDGNAEIRNLDLSLDLADTDPPVWLAVGGLAGYVNQGTITHCHLTGTVAGETYVGGLIGFNSAGNIFGCGSTTGIVAGETYVGGLIGFNGAGNIFGCGSTGSVSGGKFVGALVGQNTGTLTACESTGDVEGRNQLGGLVGNNGGTVAFCYSDAHITGLGEVGGLIGQNLGSVACSYALGSAAGQFNAGGLIGENQGDVTQCYSTAVVSGRAHAGGLIGSGVGKRVESSFWNVQTSGQSTSIGGTGLTTYKMQTAAIFLLAGWDFVGETQNGTEDIWWIVSGQSYPRLWWEAMDPEVVP